MLPQTNQAEDKGLSLYERYGKPLEETHQGQYIAISEEGKVLLGNSLVELMQRAKATFGPGSFIFKLGERSVGKWR